MIFQARVKTDTGEWIDMPIRVILLDEQGKPEVVIGSSGLQYSEFKLEGEMKEWKEDIVPIKVEEAE